MNLPDNNQFLVRLHLNDIDRGGVDGASMQMLEEWRSCQGHAPESLTALKRYADHLLCLGEPQSEYHSPDLFSVGRHSFAAKNMDRAYSEQPERAAEILEPEYRKLVSATYFEAATELEPTLEIIRGQQQGLMATYHRLLLPYRTRQGFVVVYCYSVQFGEIVRLHPVRSNESRQYHIPRTERLSSPQLLVPPPRTSLVGIAEQRPSL